MLEQREEPVKEWKSYLESQVPTLYRSFIFCLFCKWQIKGDKKSYFF